MLRALVILALVLVDAAASAQSTPRQTLDVVVMPAAGLKAVLTISPGQLAVGGDGTIYVLLNQYAEPSRARVELIAFGRDGAEKFRTALPLRVKLDAGFGYSFDSLGVVATPSGDLAVFTSTRQRTTLFRIGADGRLKKSTDLDAPNAASRRRDPDAYYSIRLYLATADNAVLLAGGFGSGPYAWWLGKFSLDGTRSWQGYVGRGFPESVNAVARRPNGWVAILQEAVPNNGTLLCHLDRYAADGKRLGRSRIDGSDCYAAVGMAGGSAFVRYGSVATGQGELIFIDDDARPHGRAPWPFASTDQMIVDGDGFAAIVNRAEVSGPDKNVVRADSQGRQKWTSPPADFSEIARAPDGQILALIWDGSLKSYRLARYADP